MTPKLTFRPVERSDKRFLFDLFVASRPGGIGPTLGAVAEFAPLLRGQFNSQERTYRSGHPNAEFWVVEVEGEPVGRLYVDRSADRIHLLELDLVPGARGKGIGGKILRRIQGEARDSGLPFTLQVIRTNPALHLYERLGFRRTGDDGVRYAMEWLPEGVD